MILHHLIALTIAIIIDLIIGDPPHLPHPVRWIGSLIYKLEKGLNKGRTKKLNGTVMLMAVLTIIGGTSLLIISCLYWIHPAAAILGEAILISTTIAQKSLKEAALSIFDPLKKGDIEMARQNVAYIVGRDTEKLDEPEIVRAAVETVAENTSDGITAPLFWALIGGAPLALMYRAINTCDSIVGYRNEKYKEFGWASARLDDVVNWIPSRLTAFSMLIGNRPESISRMQAWKIVFRDAKKHPSPNSGWGEAAVAAILGIQLGGINYYKGIVSDRAKMGDARVPIQKSHILKTNHIVLRTTPLFLLLLWLGGIFFELAFTWL
ncbi:adenosylcobinamide-phosphate synthase CbiB [Mesobacillus harenae]|uniref:adenosylcobinamide-phosphate synthase CbiB n=1 Tax=Mesobacillus harenae TaxID=2213203 RepID=UPI001580AE91|nr:adenosylcobinamide-phosphate synthase CbiB [Mesobacillus harenae]